MQDIEERASELVVARGDGSVDLEMADHALDLVALPIDTLVPADIGLARRLGRNAAGDALLAKGGANGVGVVAFVRDEVLGPRISERDHILERRAIGCFAGREVEDEREAFGITETMNFTGEPAPRAAKSLLASPPFAPAAET